jgi:hypothetical protein
MIPPKTTELRIERKLVECSSAADCLIKLGCPSKYGLSNEGEQERQGKRGRERCQMLSPQTPKTNIFK